MQAYQVNLLNIPQNLSTFQKQIRTSKLVCRSQTFRSVGNFLSLSGIKAEGATAGGSYYTGKAKLEELTLSKKNFASDVTNN